MANKLIFPDFRRIFEREKKDIARAVGTEAVRHFKENFQREGFMDGGLHRWKDVQRRNPSSPWYGFEYKGETRKNNFQPNYITRQKFFICKVQLIIKNFRCFTRQ